MPPTTLLDFDDALTLIFIFELFISIYVYVAMDKSVEVSPGTNVLLETYIPLETNIFVEG